MNKFTQITINTDKLENELDTVLDKYHQFTNYVRINEDTDTSFEITVSGDYYRTHSYGIDPIEVDLEVSVQKDDIIKSDDPVSFIVGLLVKEYNRLVANELEREMNDAIKEYENFKA